jgi:diguanylate cyclase (GGDEF)-like protein
MKIFSYFKQYRDRNKISVRIRIINFVLFLLATVVIVAVMTAVLQNITASVSKDYARLYSTNTAAVFSKYLNSEIALMKKAANSEAVIDWFADEGNGKKKAAAIEEMLEIINALSGDNIYLAINNSLNEYTIGEHSTAKDVKPYETLNRDNHDDAWFFECVASGSDYVLNVDIDKILHRKRVWINYKVERNGAPVGVICSGLGFAQAVEQKFLSEYDNTKVRCVIIDEKGIVQMDSIGLGGDNFLRFDEFRNVTDDFSDPTFLGQLKSYIGGIDGLFDSNDPVVIELSGGPYSFATIAPIIATNWSVITFFNPSSLFSVKKLVPLLIIIPVMFVFFIVVTSMVNYRVLFRPVELLVQSLSLVGAGRADRIYGLDRKDEIGSLSNAIRDMQDKAYFDMLTGAYNRRYLDESLNRIIKLLSRSGGRLCVLMVDVDYFKRYNDTYGHGMGDECLKNVAAALSDSLMRADDFAARYGGEEFAVVLPNADENGARITALRILDNIYERNIPHKASEAGRVTVSIGGAAGDVAQTYRGEDYIKSADKALYMSKQKGRNQFTFLPVQD